jgi:hypothetical protein
MITKPSVDTGRNTGLSLVAALEGKLGIALDMGEKIHGKVKLTKFVM